MATACIAQVTFGFEPKGKPIVAAFDQPHASSDGGAVLLKSLDTQLQLTKHLAGCLVDTRQPGKVQPQRRNFSTQSTHLRPASQSRFKSVGKCTSVSNT